MNQKKRLWGLILALVLCCVLVLPAYADMGPKPSVNLTLEGLEGQRYAVTMVSPKKEYGPWYVGKEYDDHAGPEDCWQAFERYQDPDGWNFLGYLEECTDTQQFSWDYYPPSPYKIVIWLAEEDTYVTSGPMERYAFDSYYTVRYAPESGLSIRRSYDYTWELISLVCRVVLTIAVELALAWLIGWRARRDVKVLLWTNVATQLGLNLALNVINYYQGSLALVFSMAVLELIVFIVEGLVYSRLLPKNPETGAKRHVWLYALGANGVSMVLGFYLAKWIPGIF